MFECGWYEVKWYNEKGEQVKNEKQYLTCPLYRREIMKMQTAFLRGEDVARLVVSPIENN